MNPRPFNPDEFEESLAAIPETVRDTAIAARLDQCALEDEFRKSLKGEGPLSGQACFVKDNFDVLGFPTRASSRFLADIRPHPRSEGPLLRKIRQTGLAVLGKTHMNEFAYGLDGANPHYGNCPHPRLPSRMSGGSSSGSAWTVGRNLVPIAFGTDTGGSIRVPAAFSGLFGLRLPPGSRATEGCFPLAPSFDAVGWLTRDSASLAFFTRHLLDLPPTPTPSTFRARFFESPSETFRRAAVDLFGDHRVNTKPPVLRMPENLVAAFNILQSREAFHLHKPWLNRFRDSYDPAVFQRISRGERWSGSQMEEAAALRSQLCSRFNGLFNDYDIILLPVAPVTAPPYPMGENLRGDLLRLTAPASLAGLAVLTIPIPHSDGATLGLQCILPPRRWKPVLASLLSHLSTRKE